MQFPSSGGFVHPSMLYEGIVSIPLFFLAWWWAKNRTREGHVLLRALLAQSVLRILVDYTRWRGDGIVFGMMLTQVVALVVALFCLVLLLVPRLPGQKN
jgi:prolipoprotein diacylglyceryltransferase